MTGNAGVAIGIRCLVLVFVVIGFIFIVSADCEDGQIDINSASVEELDEIIGIGPVYAGRIIENRPFNSVNDLTKVSGIANKTLEKIKTQGLACVDNDENKTVDEPNVVDKEDIDKEAEDDVEEIIEENVLVLNNDVEKKVETISLNNENVEGENNLVYVSKNAQVIDYLPYGFAIFLIFIIGILIWEKR